MAERTLRSLAHMCVGMGDYSGSQTVMSLSVGVRRLDASQMQVQALVLNWLGEKKTWAIGATRGKPRYACYRNPPIHVC